MTELAPDFQDYLQHARVQQRLSPRTLRLYTFLDAGNVYGENEKIDFSTLRSSYGVGFSWVSPMGPLRLAIARPITKFAGDRILPLQFLPGETAATLGLTGFETFDVEGIAAGAVKG